MAGDFKFPVATSFTKRAKSQITEILGNRVWERNLVIFIWCPHPDLNGAFRFTKPVHRHLCFGGDKSSLSLKIP